MRTPFVDQFYQLLRMVNAAVGKALNMRLVRYGDLYPWQIDPEAHRNRRRAKSVDDVDNDLTSSNPKLKALTAAYKEVDPRVTQPADWVENKLSSDELLNFRGHNPYINQLSGLNYNELGYALTYYALKSGDSRDLLETLDEDGSFGAATFEVDGRLISRDLLDSVSEIAFIRKHVGLDRPDMNILDIGAGYGRLAHRLNQVTAPNVHSFATDAFAPSTFLADYYLKYRNADRAAVVPLPEVEAFLARTNVTLAVNIHSFSECTVEAIEWWVGLLAQNNVRYLMIIPNAQNAADECLTNKRENIDPVLNRYGYSIITRQPRFEDSTVQKYGVDPSYLNLYGLER